MNVKIDIGSMLLRATERELQVAYLRQRLQTEEDDALIMGFARNLIWELQKRTRKHQEVKWLVDAHPHVRVIDLDGGVVTEGVLVRVDTAAAKVRVRKFEQRRGAGHIFTYAQVVAPADDFTDQPAGLGEVQPLLSFELIWVDPKDEWRLRL